jgi:hypothetical protein
VAADLKRALGIDSTLIEGDRGEFTVWVDQKKVCSKSGDQFPSGPEVVDAVRATLKLPTQRR